MKKDARITPENQHEPEPSRTLFLQGAMKEAVLQGYSIEDRGRLLVVALRVWEDR